MVGPPWPSGPTQFRARAMMRAVVVLPTPRTPVNTKAWARRPDWMALVSVLTMASWPISDEKSVGRYLRARTRYGAGAGLSVMGRNNISAAARWKRYSPLPPGGRGASRHYPRHARMAAI